MSKKTKTRMSTNDALLFVGMCFVAGILVVAEAYVKGLMGWGS
jgi:hypothetical protein